MPTAAPALRWTRAGLVGGSVLAVTCLAHSAGGGPLPGAPALVALLLTATFVAAPLLGRQVRTGQLAALLALEQALLHVGLMATAPPEPTRSGSAMLLAHVLATAVLAGWLGAAERRTWALLALLADRAGATVSRRVRLVVLLLGTAARPGPVRTRPLAPAADRLRPPSERFATQVVRRGPPAPVS